MAYSSGLSQTKQDFIQGTKIQRGVVFDGNGTATTPVFGNGDFFRLGAGRIADVENPNIVGYGGGTYGDNVTPAQNLTVRAFSDGAGGVTIEPETVLVLNQYDDGSGTLQTGNNNRFYVHKFYMFPRTNNGSSYWFTPSAPLITVHYWLPPLTRDQYLVF